MNNGGEERAIDMKKKFYINRDWDDAYIYIYSLKSKTLTALCWPTFHRRYPNIKLKPGETRKIEIEIREVKK